MPQVSQLLDTLSISYERIGRAESDSFTTIQPLPDGDSDSLIFANRPKDETLQQLQSSPAAVILVESTWGHLHRDALAALDAAVFLVKAPRLAVGKMLNHLISIDPPNPRIHPTAVISENARLHETVIVGPYAVIGEAEIGAHSRIGSHTVVHDRVEIGERVNIREHCVIGSDACGIAKDEDAGTLVHIPHIGKTVIEDDVDIFPFVNVDRGTLKETRVGRGSKVDHYSYISHNSALGEHCIVTGGATLCGSSRVGNNVWLGINTIIKQGIEVGDDVVTGLGAVILNNVESGDVVAGVPAKSLKKR